MVVLNYPSWQQKFGGDPDAIGRKPRMSGELYTIVGVAAPGPQRTGQASGHALEDFYALPRRRSRPPPRKQDPEAACCEVSAPSSMAPSCRNIPTIPKRRRLRLTCR